MANFDGQKLNALIALLVFLFGEFHRRKLAQGVGRTRPYLRHAFLCWWFVWLTWVLAWMLNTLLPVHEYAFKLGVIAIGEVSGVLLFGAYLFLTRGDKITASEVVVRMIFVLAVLFISYAAIALKFFDNPDMAMRLIQRWSLCMGMIVPLIFGWAMHLRYRAALPLIMGYVYGLSQPVAFEALFEKQEGDGKLAGAAALLILAVLKISWAAVTTRQFLLLPNTDDSLVIEVPDGEHIELLKNWSPTLLAQCMVLLAIILGAWIQYFPSDSKLILEMLAVPSSIVAAVSVVILLLRRLK